MFTRNYKKFGVFRDKHLFISAICKAKQYHSEEFKTQLTKLIRDSTEDEYVEAVYDAMTSPDNLERTALDFCTSAPSLSRKISCVEKNWDRFFPASEWKFVPVKQRAWKK